MNIRVLFPCLFLVLTGCATTPAERIARNQTAYASWPPDVQAAVRAGEIGIGFTPEQVHVALGEPDRVKVHTTAGSTDEVWIYRQRAPRVTVGVGVGGGGGSTRVSGATVISTGGPYNDVAVRVVFTAGRVSAVERVAR